MCGWLTIAAKADTVLAQARRLATCFAQAVLSRLLAIRALGGGVVFSHTGAVRACLGHHTPHGVYLLYTESLLQNLDPRRVLVGAVGTRHLGCWDPIKNSKIHISNPDDTPF